MWATSLELPLEKLDNHTHFQKLFLIYGCDSLHKRTAHKNVTYYGYVQIPFQRFHLFLIWYFVLKTTLFLLLMLIGVNSTHQEEISSNLLLFLNSTFFKNAIFTCLYCARTMRWEAGQTWYNINWKFSKLSFDLI